MSGDAKSLRSLLASVDATAPAIQATANAMMKHYDRSAEVAVTEWRNALHNSRHRDQWLPLLYVANEVLQTSKRNRGNKFLEAFSPILGQSLMYVCQHSDGSVVEKIRRTVKIWADRRVFSVRYINELLQGLEPYRNNRGSTAPTPSSSSQQVPPQSPTTTTAHDGASFSPATTTPSPHLATAHGSTTNTGATANNNNNNNNNTQQQQDEEDSDDPMDIFNDNEEEEQEGGEEEDDDDDDNVFGSSDGGAKLDVEINFESSALNSPHHGAAQTNNSSSGNRMIKRRRSSTASAGSQQSSQHKKRRKMILSTSSLSELWKQVSSLQQSFDHSMAKLQDIHLPSPEQLDNLVGDELLEHYQTIVGYQERVQQERQTLHRIATERHALEQEAVRYIPWLETALKQDAEDIRFCQTLETALQKFMRVHPAIQQARDTRVQEELQYRRQQEEQERKRKQEEESKKFREAALSKQEEAKPGMVWNKVTQEYQYLNTDESWRD